MIKQGARAKQVRKKQMLVAAAATAIVLVLAAGAAVLVNDTTPNWKATQAEVQPEIKPIVTGGAAFNDKEAWRQQLSAEVAGLRKQMEEERAKSAADTRQAVETAVRSAKSGSTAPPLAPPAAPPATEFGSPPQQAAASVFAPPLPPPPPSAAQQQGSDGSGRTVAGQGAREQQGRNPLFQAGGASTVPPPAGSSQPGQATIGSVRFDDPPAGQAGQVSSGGNPQGGGSGVDDDGGPEAKKRSANYIPAGTFVRVVVLNGLDAPTGGQAQQNPSPVLLKVLDSATMPNGYKANLAGCVMTANGYGDVSSERSYIRLDRLTCISEEGGAIEVAVKGYVAGEDGKSGMRGKLVSKTGQILANGLMAAVGSGIGQAFNNSATTTNTNPFGGQTSTVNPGQQFQAGVGKGLGSAFEQLSKYYISLAEKTFPIIEIDGGRVTDVVFSRGFTLEGR